MQMSIILFRKTICFEYSTKKSAEVIVLRKKRAV